MTASGSSLNLWRVSADLNSPSRHFELSEDDVVVVHTFSDVTPNVFDLDWRVVSPHLSSSAEDVQHQLVSLDNPTAKSDIELSKVNLRVWDIPASLLDPGAQTSSFDFGNSKSGKNATKDLDTLKSEIEQIGHTIPGVKITKTNPRVLRLAEFSDRQMFTMLFCCFVSCACVWLS